DEPQKHRPQTKRKALRVGLFLV
ncbi:MAG: Unknown protein, partial [uncultured Sulfurovum sp.]